MLGELEAQGAYLCDAQEQAALESVVIRPGGGVNPDVVGKSAPYIASLAGIRVPKGVRTLLVRYTGVGPEYPLSAEKLCPVLAFYVEKNWEDACERCIELLSYGGLGHSLVIHSGNQAVIREFALRKPVNRIMVNTPASQGAIGLTTGLDPSLTLGCGSWGGNITSDNVGPLHLINRKRLAYHLGGMLVTPEYRAAARGDGHRDIGRTGREGGPQGGRAMRPQLTERERAVLDSMDDTAIVRLVDAALSDMV